MQLTLQQLFGVNAFQDGQVLQIKKSDLPLLTPSVNNSSESLLVAILLKVLENFSNEILDSNNQPILDSDNKLILRSGELFDDLNVFRWQDVLIKRGEILFVRKTIVVESVKEYAEI